MLSALAIVASIAVADAINPATVAPALYLATTERPLRRLVSFAAAFFAVNFAGGVLIMLGPGKLLLDNIPHISEGAKHWIELVTGLILIGAATYLALSDRPTPPEARRPPAPSATRAAALGATLAAVELPTALPYFAALAAIIAADLSLASQLLLVAAFNAIFIAPVLAMIAVLAIVGDRAIAHLRRLGDALRTHWRTGFAVLAGAAGTVLVAFGVLGMP